MDCYYIALVKLGVGGLEEAVLGNEGFIEVLLPNAEGRSVCVCSDHAGVGSGDSLDLTISVLGGEEFGVGGWLTTSGEDSRLRKGESLSWRSG